MILGVALMTPKVVAVCVVLYLIGIWGATVLAGFLETSDSRWSVLLGTDFSDALWCPVPVLIAMLMFLSMVITRAFEYIYDKVVHQMRKMPRSEYMSKAFFWVKTAFRPLAIGRNLGRRFGKGRR